MNRFAYYLKKLLNKRIERLSNESLLSAENIFNRRYRHEHSQNGKIKVCTYQTGFARHFTRFYTSTDNRDYSFNIVDEPKNADVVVFINTVDSKVVSPSQQVILFFHEPKDYAHLYQTTIDWSRVTPGQLRVVSHLPVETFITNPGHAICHRSIPYVHFHHMAAYDDLGNLDSGKRTKLICSITSGFNGIPGYQKRREFIAKLAQTNDGFDLFGRFSKEAAQLAAYRGPCTIKWKTLADYKYNLVIENSDDEYYISEKIFDALICGSMPIYHGSERIFELVPKEWFYFLPTLEDNEIGRLNEFLTTDSYRNVSENREQIAKMIYDSYSFYQALDNLLRSEPLPFTPSRN